MNSNFTAEKNMRVPFLVLELNCLRIAHQVLFNLKRISEILYQQIFRKDLYLPEKTKAKQGSYEDKWICNEDLRKLKCLQFNHYLDLTSRNLASGNSFAFQEEIPYCNVEDKGKKKQTYGNRDVIARRMSQKPSPFDSDEKLGTQHSGMPTTISKNEMKKHFSQIFSLHYRVSGYLFAFEEEIEKKKSNKTKQKEETNNELF